MPPASKMTVSFELPDEPDSAGIASGCVRDVGEVGDRTKFALILWSKGGGETVDEVVFPWVFPNKTEFPKEGLLSDTSAVTLLSNAECDRDGVGTNVTCICVGRYDPNSNSSIPRSRVDRSPVSPRFGLSLSDRGGGGPLGACSCTAGRDKEPPDTSVLRLMVVLAS